jgi:hypothetical protein
MTKLTGAALDKVVAKVLGIKSVHNCEKWVGLTDDEVNAATPVIEEQILIRVMEAKLKEKNT